MDAVDRRFIIDLLWVSSKQSLKYMGPKYESPICVRHFRMVNVPDP